MPKIGFIFRKVDGKSSETFPIFLFNLTDFDADMHDIEGNRCCLSKSSQLTWSVGLWYLICWYTQLDNGRYGQTLFVNYILRRVQKLYVCSYHSVKLWYQVQGIGIQELIYRNKKITVLAVSKEKKSEYETQESCSQTCKCTSRTFGTVIHVLRVWTWCNNFPECNRYS